MSDGAVRRRGLFSDTRVKVALWIAVGEALITAIKGDISKFTVIAIAIPVILFHLLAGRSLESPRARAISWTLALSQAFAVIAVIVAALFSTLVLILAGFFAAVALLLFWLDRSSAQSR